MTIAKTIARAWTDSAFKDKLVSDPHAALAEQGLAVPEGTTVTVVENTEDTVHVVLPVTPAEAGKLSAEELEHLAGGSVLVLTDPARLDNIL